MKRRSFLCYVMLFLAFAVSVSNAEDPDYSNDWEGAQEIVTDGTIISGELTSGDQDWFRIGSPGYTQYSVYLKGQQGAGYKKMDIYQQDEFGTLYSVLNISVWGDEIYTGTIYIESNLDLYVKVRENPGQYQFYIQSLVQVFPDGYSDECATATALDVAQDPIVGILEHNGDGTLNDDWFVFDTEPQHKYEVRLTHTNNTYVYASLFDSQCNSLVGNSTIITVTSWFGEQYKIRTTANAVYLGNYYTIDIVDLGLCPDDYSNVYYQNPTVVPVDDTMVYGKVDFSSTYQSDEDWFIFTPVPNSLYRITLKGEINAGYKHVNIFQIDAFDDLHKTLEFSSWSNEIQSRTFFVEKPEDIYLKAFYNNGEYEFYIEYLGQYLPDGVADDCSNPVTLTVDAAPMSGTLSHFADGTLESDWYVFETEPLHKYEIRLISSDNSYPYFSVYSSSCSNVLGNNTYSTVTSWFGEDYKLKVNCSSSYLGVYYTIEVNDLGLCDDDYPNVYYQAVEIPKDGTYVDGEIQFDSSYQADEDWFTFTAALEGNYDFSLIGEVSKGYKIVDIYWQDGNQVLRHKKNASVWSDGVSNFTVNLPAGEIFVKMYYNLGKYSISVLSPDPRCGDLDHPYPLGDVNQDCKVNLEDFALMAANWLTCNSPVCQEEAVE